MPTVPALPNLPVLNVPSADKARTALTDAAYVGVGAAVLTAQQILEARKEVQERLEDGFAKLINLRSQDVRSEVRGRIENFAKAGREALGKQDMPAPKTSAAAAKTKAAA
jgi:hypothetical protein